MPNQLKLFLILLIGIGIGGFLFYKGLVSSQDISDKSTGVTETLEPDQVLGEEIRDSEKAETYETKVLQGFQKVSVLKVIDGDTIEVDLDGKVESVRFIGIDTPETVDPRRPVGCFGKEASSENKRLLEGKVVLLERDISETDKYNRLLRYIYLELGNRQMLFVNDYLVRQGFAFASSFPPDVKYNERFTKAQEEARENLRGLWRKC